MGQHPAQSERWREGVLSQSGVIGRVANVNVSVTIRKGETPGEFRNFLAEKNSHDQML